ncbi:MULTISPECIES: HpcH/HpaI aldolase family protein [unclassified Sedimentibacter]|uniref:HpcH/HpaI aldolase family protein n=1 Tax=unclassified Sedimentibacter TaxID=2649220 RepID=UPI0027DF168F|nr:aldolase/citrate lyase family protein [Sedimentibacter sp. MB35-C1]WMJ76947.1 aldolase/citrate lyase family protein [Sedimentibacter sp. MB35-C1]
MNKQYSLRQRIFNKEVVVGMFVKFNSQAIAEMIGNSGFDFIIIDAEHSNYSSYDVEGIIRASECAGMSTVVRVREAIPEDVLHALDSGADGIQIPSITSIETAKVVCKSSKYYPEGNRGFTTTQRSAMYSSWNKDEPYIEYANKNSLVVVHVENKEMADKIDDLLEIPQLDVIFVGPADLSQSMGKPGKANDPEVLSVIEDVFKKTLSKGKAVGINCTSPIELKKYVSLGATYIAYGSDTAVVANAFKKLKELADGLGLPLLRLRK